MSSHAQKTVARPTSAVFDSLFNALPSSPCDRETLVGALALSRKDTDWREAFLDTDFASLVMVNGQKFPFDTHSLFAKEKADSGSLEVTIDLHKLHRYPALARAMLAYAIQALHDPDVYGRIDALTINKHDSYNHTWNFDVNNTINDLFFAGEGRYLAPPTLVIDSGKTPYRCETPVEVNLGLVRSLSVRSTFLSDFSFAAAAS